nr:hypothetical protein CFP56_17246 [Quercus suber]
MTLSHVLAFKGKILKKRKEEKKRRHNNTHNTTPTIQERTENQTKVASPLIEQIVFKVILNQKNTRSVGSNAL